MTVEVLWVCLTDVLSVMDEVPIQTGIPIVMFRQTGRSMKYKSGMSQYQNPR